MPQIGQDRATSVRSAMMMPLSSQAMVAGYRGVATSALRHTHSAYALATPSSDAMRSSWTATKLERRGVFSSVWPCGLASTQSMNAHSRQAKQIAWDGVGATQKADLAELADWVEGPRAPAHTARVQGNISLAKALDITRFKVYEGYLDEELDHQRSQATARRSASRLRPYCSDRAGRVDAKWPQTFLTAIMSPIIGLAPAALLSTPAFAVCSDGGGARAGQGPRGGSTSARP
jgi:hypothetical protein